MLTLTLALTLALTRTRMLQVLGMRPPKVVGSAVVSTKTAEDDTYKALVGEMGY